MRANCASLGLRTIHDRICRLDLGLFVFVLSSHPNQKELACSTPEMERWDGGRSLFSAQPLALIPSHLMSGTVLLRPIRIYVLQFRVPQRIIDSTQTGISLVVHGAILQRRSILEVPEIRRAQETPDLRQMPINDRVNAHKRGPIVVGRIEMCEMASMRVGAPSTDKDGADGGVGVKIKGKGVAE